MRHLTTFALLVAAFAFTASDVRADHDHRLHEVVCDYRDSVREFERAVRRSHSDPYARRLVSQWEDLACELHAASRHPEDIDRLNHLWSDIECVQGRVDRALFHSPYYYPSPQLAACWETIARHSQCVARELAAVQIPVYPQTSYRVPNSGIRIEIARPSNGQYRSHHGGRSYQQQWDSHRYRAPVQGYPAPHPHWQNDTRHGGYQSAAPRQPNVSRHNAGDVMIGALLSRLLD